MSPRYVIKPKADRDLDELADYMVRESSLELAMRFFNAAHSTFSLLATRPHIGWRSRVKYPGLEALRVFRLNGFENVLVLYRLASEGIDILRVVHGSRNLRSLLRREGLE